MIHRFYYKIFTKFISLQLVFVSAEELSTEVRSTVEILQNYFTSHREAYYRDFLFFFSLFVHKLFPGISRLILMDIDIKVSILMEIIFSNIKDELLFNNRIKKN